MGIGTSMKETTKHYYKDPLLEVVSVDKDVNLRAIVVVGSPDGNADKMRAGERVGVLLESMHIDGAIFSCNGEGNNHVDYAKSIEETEKRGIPVSVMSFSPTDRYVVNTDFIKSSVCFYQSSDENMPTGQVSYILAEQTYEKKHVVHALALLKQRMRNMDNK